MNFFGKIHTTIQHKKSDYLVKTFFSTNWGLTSKCASLLKWCLEKIHLGGKSIEEKTFTFI